ncbi:hypothetical protein KY290_015143 [Solanum tuberosum]|uniref:Uncharacterized protein n=1 Tax=Solanum tuberosum TaxID=4113 RepID=A0ABQ7VRM0_SOLTU|nr:hypothetical protein KY289_014762 [Solanum tuberosum]KAH0771162.1 hypothetical protein KY290_015143 [Solanum tuberosum]
MISTTIRGRYEGGVREAVTTVTVHGGAVKFNGNVTEATFVNGSSLEGLSFSLALSLSTLTSPNRFVIWAWDFYVGGLKFETPCQRKQGVCLLGRTRRIGFASVFYMDVRFQFMNNMRVMEKPLNFTYTHWRGDNRTVVDGTLAIDSSNKLSANYGFDSGNCKLGYSYVHKGLTTFEPSYDLAKNSWDVSLSQRVDEDNVVKASYQSASKVLGLEWCKNPSSSGGFKVPFKLNSQP